jgi:hypothetical protein
MFEAGINSACYQERCLQIVLETMLVVFKPYPFLYQLSAVVVVCHLHSFNVVCFQERSYL